MTLLLTQSLDNACGVAHMPTASHYYGRRFTPDYYTDLIAGWVGSLP
jgi:hypothetical protein